MANCPWQWHRGNFLISKKSRCLLRVACGKCHKHWCKSKSPRQPSRIHLEFPPWQLPRGSGIAAILQLQKVTLPVPRCLWPMPPTSLHCGRLPVAVASLQLSLCQAYRCLLRFQFPIPVPSFSSQFLWHLQLAVSVPRSGFPVAGPVPGPSTNTMLAHGRRADHYGSSRARLVPQDIVTSL